MTDYSKWELASRSVKALTLDARNPRIPPAGSSPAESSLIEELTLHDDVLDVAKSIAANGFFPNEPLVAIRESGQLVVVEGNRRLAACKLLDDSELAPVSFRPKFKTLAAGANLAFLKKLPVLFAPSRESTIPLMIARHTASQLVQWAPAMKAAFYAQLVKGGMTTEDVAKRFGVEAGEVKSSLKDHHLYQMACKLSLPSEVATRVRNPRDFPLTTLGRIFDNPKARAFFGVDFTESGQVLGKIAQGEFAKAFTKAVADVATGTEDSRTLGSAQDILRYLDTYGTGNTPNLAQQGTFDADTFLLAQAPPTAKPTQTKPKKALKTKTPVGLIPRGITCGAKNQRVRDLLNELQKLSPARFPNACAVTFRCFLEVSVYCYLDSKGEVAKMTQEYKQGISDYNAKLPTGKNPRIADPSWSPTLSEMMKRLADPNRGLLKNAQVTKALAKLIHDEGELLTFNLFAHNPTYSPTETKLRSTWKNTEEFFKLILA